MNRKAWAGWAARQFGAFATRNVVWYAAAMASKREARRQGYEYGFGIAAENFGELFEEYGKAILIGQESDFLSFFVGKVSEMESEHFRQFTPFEFIAQDFNSSRDPDAVWEAYEEGVAQGALAAAKVGLQGCDRVYQLP